jgi:hypothetical protein
MKAFVSVSNKNIHLPANKMAENVKPAIRWGGVA